MSEKDNSLEYVYNEVLIVMERLLKEDQNPLAIAAGSNIVRIGSLLFGARVVKH
jgi:hypothetical protein